MARRPHYSLKDVLEATAADYGINAAHPAFNEGVFGEVKFAEILDRLGLDTGRLAPKAA